ncbi:Threonylcarbamoyladenosine tRNA methylthiotransferase [Labeo rohita]|uniref:Threonylcarbamoyladenosine tRNA methylthiotransferase n=1 Tax=Labeo rohita TaxID=84645 RepID=A0ABQ8LYX3_LABRO|nr:Threonylcarbamoyladenosine tRNA methylthiotransferase [Labeo rohita]
MRFVLLLLPYRVEIMPSACDSLVDDIEDMVTSHDPTPHERQFSRRNIVPRPRKHKLQPAGEELQTDSVIPGTQKVWVRTWGCSHNSSDGEYMAGQLAASGYKITAPNANFSESFFFRLLTRTAVADSNTGFSCGTIDQSNERSLQSIPESPPL